MPQRLIPALAALLLAVSPRPAAAKGGAYRESAHGRRDAGVQRVPGIARGECSHCHGNPRNALGARAEGQGHAQLFAQNDNALCIACHAANAGSWLGELRYGQALHGSDPGTVWPGPSPRAREAQDSGKCVNCHDPHGVKDARGLVPAMLRIRGVALCLGCHAGNPATDVASAFAKAYRHPLLQEDAASSALAQPPAMAAAGDAADGGSCGACHNPHAAGSAAGAAAAGAPPALAGVARVRVSNGAPGEPPLQVLADRGSATPGREYEVCLKCHSPTAVHPARGSAVATALNPANASFHPVEAPGRNRAIDRRAFETGWGPERLVSCSDCHGTDAGVTRGPHGSSFPHLLKARYVPRNVDEPMRETDLCFACHAWATYGDTLAAEAAIFSRFRSHATHVARGYGCGFCHQPHGSVDRPSLVILRTPGMLTYAQTAAGGSCTTTCHTTTRPDVTYSATYSR